MPKSRYSEPSFTTCVPFFRFCVEGKDTYNVLQPALKESGVLSIANDSPMTSNDVMFYGGGDMMLASCVYGLGGVFQGHAANCPWCTVQQRHMGKVFDTSKMRRNVITMTHAAHRPYRNRFPFQCPYCSKRFFSAADLETDTSPKDKNAYRLAHRGQVHGQPPLLDIDPVHWIPCTLHMTLALSRLLWKLSVPPSSPTQKIRNFICCNCNDTNTVFVTCDI